MEKKKEVLPQVVPQAETNVVLQGDPTKQLEYAQKAATALMQVVQNKKKKVVINGEQYLEFEDWMTIGRFYGGSVGVEWTRELRAEGKIIGYEARANVLMNDKIISSAEAMCLNDELNWKARPLFMLRSMAQTRASAKALRNVFAFVATMAGFKPTPAEEMDGIGNDTKKTAKAPQKAELPIIVEPISDEPTVESIRPSMTKNKKKMWFIKFTDGREASLFEEALLQEFKVGEKVKAIIRSKEVNGREYLNIACVGGNEPDSDLYY